jgi:hypothetical protein
LLITASLKQFDRKKAWKEPMADTLNLAEIARLRPMMPLDALASLMGSRWSPPSDHGHILGTFDDGFGARVEIGGRIGTMGFYKSFPSHFLIEKLHVGMPLAEALVARPTLELLPDESDVPAKWSQYRDRTDDGFDLTVRVRDGAIGAVEISQPGAVFPEPVKLEADPRITHAYDLIRDSQRLQPVTDRGMEWAGGWSLGLPPGITPTQWPLSPRLGHPLRHAFTLHIPPEYRRQGEDLVALSLFVDDQFEDLPASDAVEAFFAAPVSVAPLTDTRLLPLWAHRRERHPRHFDMSDVLGVHYAAIWLTQAEFDGPLCTPPDLSGNPLLSPPPRWLSESYADYFQGMKIRNRGDTAYSWLPGNGRSAGLATAFPIRAMQREDDPNVGRPAREWEHECKDSGYIRPFTSEEGKALKLERFYGRNHLGGTMFPAQGYPEFGPSYLECEEDFGGFNFGGGNGQIDLEKMALDWACG